MRAPAKLPPRQRNRPKARILTRARQRVAPPKGATRDMVALGHKIYLGQVGGASCTGCHGMNGGGCDLGPPLSEGRMDVERRRFCRMPERD